MKYAIKVPVDNGWLYVTETDANGDLVARTFDTREEAEALKKSIDYLDPDALSQVVGYHKDALGNTIFKLTEEEIEELRAKKQAIKEELYDKVKMEMFKASSKLEGIDYELPYSTRKEAADEKIGKWLSAALEDPTTCGAMKDDINEWFMASEVERRLRTKKKQKTDMFDQIEYEGIEVQCKTHPDAPHGFDRNASLSLGRYVCECEYWEPDWEPEKLEVHGWDITKSKELQQLLESMCTWINFRL